MIPAKLADGLLPPAAAFRVGRPALFYLVAPTTAVLAWLVFDERLAPAGMAGMGLAALGVWLVARAPGPARERAPAGTGRTGIRR